jgi:1-acyl-sn-glycerol-3-phosphate acyltransferase
VTHDPGSQARWNAQAGSRVRAALGFPFLVLFAFGSVACMVLLGFVAPATLHRSQRRFFHVWGRVALWLQGVRLTVHGREHLDGPGARLVFFNHQSVLDLFVMTALWPERGVVIYKQEFHRVPFIGRLLRALEMVPIDRSDRSRAIQELQAAGTRVRTRCELLFVAPEGTRSRKPGLGAFKRGPFHLATATGLPIVPLVMRGVRQVLPDGHLLARSGQLRVDILPPIPTGGWAESHLDEQIASVRAIYLRYLPDAAPEAVAPPTPVVAPEPSTTVATKNTPERPTESAGEATGS